MTYNHIPVMLEEVIQGLNLQKGKNYIDCTLGGAGYTLKIAQNIGDGKVLGIDLDTKAIKNAEEKIKKSKIKNIILTHDNFKNLSQIVKKNFKQEWIKNIGGIIFDLGLSSAQLEDRSRGFSFLVDAALIMNFNQEAEENKTADYILNNYSEKELAEIFEKYGEERFAKRIARGIEEQKQISPIKTTFQLVEIIKKVVPKKFHYAKIHPATKVFQALRISVNDELTNLLLVLKDSLALLPSGSRLAVVSFHSLEDRLVKNFFRQEAKDCICPPSYPACRCQHKARLKILTKKIIQPTEQEVESNPRSRSAKLRVAEKI